MDSQEETVSIQWFEIGIHKDLPIKETIFIYFFWGGGLGGGSSEVLLNGFFSLSFPDFFNFRQIEASIGGRGRKCRLII